MWAFFERLLDSSMFSPHGICLLWEPELIWLHVASDVVIAAAYFSIPVALSIFVSKRRDVDFGWVFWAFALFIMACGVGHVMSIITLWYPVYGIEGIVKAMTAAASIVTAAMLWPLLPKVLALPSPSQRRRAEAALAQEGMRRREAEDMLRQSQKMEAIGQLTGGVAHDFNNLLTIISGNLEIGVGGLHSWGDSTGERLTRVIGNAANGAQRAAMLTHRLLAFARRQTVDPRLTNVNQLPAGMSDFVRRTLGENIDLEIVGGAGLWQVEVDPSQMEATILNLVVNAKDAMAGKGKLTIETSNAFVDERYSQQNADIPVGQYVQIAVSDNGSRMYPDGAVALALFDSDPFRIDLLLTDIVMPGMNGRQLANELLHRQPSLKVLFMTGYSRNAIVHQGRLDPGVSMLQKPLTQVILAAKIRDMLDRP